MRTDPTHPRLLIATDAWRPQVNGVVMTLEATIRELERRGCATEVVSPDLFRSLPMPGYPEIRLAHAPQRRLARIVEDFRPDHVHLATEGPVGWAMRRLCLRRGLKFSTCYHTRFPEYVRKRAPAPTAWTYALLRRFHRPSGALMVATASMERELAARGFANLRRWGRGVDLAAFRPQPAPSRWPRPVFLSVGRLAPEKNLDAFLALDLPGTKVVVGDGPDAPRLRARHPDAVFLGARPHADLPAIYSAADVFVFPSLTDTFGLVLAEAMACGLPVAAFPAPGPLDVVGASGAGVVSDDLRAAALAALDIDRARVRRHAERFSWSAATDQFLAAVAAAEGWSGPEAELLAAE